MRRLYSSPLPLPVEAPPLVCVPMLGPLTESKQSEVSSCKSFLRVCFPAGQDCRPKDRTQPLYSKNVQQCC